MVWLMVGGIALLTVIATFCTWTVFVYLAEVGDAQDGASDDTESGSTRQADDEPRLESDFTTKRRQHRAARY